MSISCDIIVPTYNQADVLASTLTALFAQKITSPASLQLLLIDDGSTDSTPTLIKALSARSPWPVRSLIVPHGGGAAARNQALAISEATIVLFLGGDIVLHPEAVQAHLSFHKKISAPRFAALGHVSWDPHLSPSPLMEWMIHGGPQNDFDALLDQSMVDPAHYFYGSHLSLKREFIQGEKFSEEFTRYGWEDLEFGRRLAARGLVLQPLFTAQGFHRHYYTLSDIVNRQRAAGASVMQYQQHHPTIPLAPLPTRMRKFKFWLIRYTGISLALRFFLRYSGERWSTPRLFFSLTTVEYWHGVFSAQEGN